MPPDPADGASAVRPSDADREALAGLLGRHYAAGRLDADALSERLEVVFSARSLAGAAAVLADLPAVLPVAARPGSRGRHGEAATAGDGWVPTRERFRDPSTRRLMRVWVDPAGRTRHYIAE